MFLSSHEIARSRTHALNNLLDLSAACMDAARRFGELLSSTRREAAKHGSQHFSLVENGRPETIAQVPAAVWLDSAARAARLLDGTLEILGETHKAMIRNAEAQVRMVDEMVFATLNRATRTSPWEAEFALHAMKASLQNAEQALHDMSDAAIETVTLAEKEIHQTTEILAPSSPAQRRRAASGKKSVAA